MTDIRYSPKRWSHAGGLSTLLAKGLTPPRPPVLILSLPRCGSSWVGKMLGQSRQGLYLREPMNQSKLEIEGEGTVFMVHGDDAPSNTYRAAADDAFRGIPRFSRRVVKEPSQWRVDRLLYRSHVLGGRVVIKDVNPLALRWLLANHQFKLIFLTRHPAAVAASWHRMGWTEGIESRLEGILGQELSSEIQSEHTKSLWSCHGAMQALVYRYVFDTLDSIPHDSYRTVSYESLCKDPEEAFQDLFEFAGFPFDEHTRKRVRQHSRKEEDRKEEPYSTHRRSTDMVNAWRRDLPKGRQSEIRESYLAMDPPIYKEKAWSKDGAD